MIKIGLLGLGTVGSGVYEIITCKSNYFQSLLGEKVEITKILVKDINKKRAVTVPFNLLTNNPSDILDDSSIDIIVETIGGVDDAFKFISSALTHKKHVVTANKAVVAKHMRTLLSLSEKNEKAFLFEASVGGGIPIIKPLKQYSVINDVKEIKGILNGTTNFILTKMYEDDLSFQQALRIAQDLGYAEADPTDDIEGYDVARKLAILSSIAFKNETKFENIKCRGISSISQYDFKVFKEIGCQAKLLGTAVLNHGSLSASVEPVLINENSSFAMVKDAYNIISVTGSVAGELQFYGQGAGKNPTANAVVSDIMDIVTGSYKSDFLSHESFDKSPETNELLGQYYVRITPNSNETLSSIIDILTEQNIIYKLINRQSNVVLITKEILTDKIAFVTGQLNKFMESCCYVRLGEINVLELSAKITN